MLFNFTERGKLFMRDYGLWRKCLQENLKFKYAKTYGKILSTLPNSRKKHWKTNYTFCFKGQSCFGRRNNSIPENHFLSLYTIVTADLIHRDDIKKLQKGLRYLLMTKRSNRYINVHTDGLNKLFNRIENMDSTLLSWFEGIDCGIFEFQNHKLKSIIDHFTIKIHNMGSAYLGIEFSIYLAKDKRSELEKLIKYNFNDDRGYATSTFIARKNKIGSFKSYSVIHYNNNDLKSDKIYEFISRVQWEFYQALNNIFPFTLHRSGIMPPRIETYYTDIDYHEKCKNFWNSLGIEENSGQFIDQNQKVFFDYRLSARYELSQLNNRLIYIFKDDGIDSNDLNSIQMKAYFHLQEYAKEYFKILFLYIFSKELGKIVVSYKHKLDKIGLRRNCLKSLLKLKYNFSLDINNYHRYLKDDIWEEVSKILGEVYLNNKAKNISYQDFCQSAKFGSQKVNKDITLLLSEIENKEHILKSLYEYKNTIQNKLLNILMLFISAVTLFLVIFPEKAGVISDVIILMYHCVENLINKCIEGCFLF